MDICSVPTCDRPLYNKTHGLCQPHYVRLRTSGSVQAHKPIRLRNAPIEAIFWQHVDKRGDDECWPWTGTLTYKGYGQAYCKTSPGGTKAAHRQSYELLVGPIPEGLTIDHLCRNKACVNPRHLEPVSNGENKRRASRLQTHCVNGHPLSGDNIYPNRQSRTCVTCARERAAKWQRENKDRIKARGRKRR